MKYKVILLILLGYAQALFAQQPVKPVVDSTMIKTLFFAGLKDKLNEDYSKALESFNKILVLDPGNAAVHYEIAILNYKQNKLIEAEVAIKKALALDGNNAWYWMMMAELQKRKGDMLVMADVLNQLIRLSPEKEDYYFDRCHAYLLAGKTADAIKGYDEIEKKFGNSALLIKARRRITTGKKENLIEPVATEETEMQEQAMLVLGEKLYKQGNLNEALAQFKMVLQNTDQIYGAWERTIEIQLALKQYKDAIKTTDAALSFYPNQAILYYYMALALQKNNQYTQALISIKSALQLDAGNEACLELYGDVLFLNGDKELALVQWKKSKAAGNGSEKLNKKINEQKYLE